MPVRIEEALQQSGLGSGLIEWSKLAALDQFHVRGLSATKELALGLGLQGGATVLDVGSGLGGPARHLAAVHGCYVTGIDLTPLFIEISEQLSQRTGLAGRLRFVHGDALDLPFPTESFDHAWTQHVAMNIPDKRRFYEGIHRVLRKSGRLAIYDVVRGENEPAIYPVPWARHASMSFLASPAEMAQTLSATGFIEASTIDTTDLALTWFDDLFKAQQEPAGIPPLSLGRILGPESVQIMENVVRNIKEGRIRLLQIIVEKA
jgi:SAM-dependent methyltransferase